MLVDLEHSADLVALACHVLRQCQDTFVDIAQPESRGVFAKVSRKLLTLLCGGNPTRGGQVPRNVAVTWQGDASIKLLSGCRVKLCTCAYLAADDWWVVEELLCRQRKLADKPIFLLRQSVAGRQVQEPFWRLPTQALLVHNKPSQV